MDWGNSLEFTKSIKTRETLETLETLFWGGESVSRDPSESSVLKHQKHLKHLKHLKTLENT